MFTSKGIQQRLQLEGQQSRAAYHEDVLGNLLSV